MMALRARLLAAALALPALSCGTKAPNAPAPPDTTAAATLTIGAGGIVTPKSVEIPLGGRVLFVNNDTRSHNVGSDPHPEHNECPSINQAGYLLPGEHRETGNFVITRACGFHDHDDPNNRGLWGTITTK